MKGARIKSVTAEMLTTEARKLRDTGGRMQFAYAWTPHGGDSEIRYVAALPERTGFRDLAVEIGEQSSQSRPHLAAAWLV